MLRDEGFEAGRFKVRDLMKERGLISKQPEQTGKLLRQLVDGAAVL
ncbi:hypothetical protein DXT77_03040 [Pseudomonas sp. 91RF]|jgi:hypothetical protein|nr:hypothetical protein DXT77_03040 [Pseudomonas sp. 91RF]